jgi:hypothetical protein
MRDNMNEKDDDQWLAALSGKPDPHASEATNRQAALLRQAMLKRRAELENETASAEPSEFARLQKRLEAEGLISRADPTYSGSKAKGFMAWLANVFPGKNGGVAALPVWSLAVNCALVVVVAVQFMSPSQDLYESNVLRGGGAFEIFADDPSVKLTEIIKELDARYIRYVIRTVDKQGYELLIQDGEDSMNFLIEKRYQLNSEDGVYTLLIQKRK